MASAAGTRQSCSAGVHFCAKHALAKAFGVGVQSRSVATAFKFYSESRQRFLRCSPQCIHMSESGPKCPPSVAAAAFGATAARMLSKVTASEFTP